MHTHALYDAAGTRALDRYAIEQCGMPGLTLMQAAGAAVFAECAQRWPRARRITVVCGGGNNGGDGFVIARLAHGAGLSVRVLLLGARERISGDAAQCLAEAEAVGLRAQEITAQAFNADLVIDAVFGTGLERAVSGPHAQAIALINEAGCPVVAVDVPSGLNASTGARLGSAVQADLTVTFIAIKQGLLTGAGPALCGELVLADLDVPAAAYEAVAPSARALDYSAVAAALRPRRLNAHKGDFGHVLIVGGAPGFAGAARLAAEAAARAGAGLVSLATHPDHAASVCAMRPEIMCHAVVDGAALRRLSARASVIAIGPGLGQDRWGRELFAAARATRLLQVVDADGLNLLADDPDTLSRRIITPHPGEAARLLGSSSAEVNADRFAAVAALAQRYGGVAVLKGAGTLVSADAQAPWLIRGGNPGMASGGMGDVLTGVIAALCAQHYSLHSAAAIGACIHAHAADCAAAQGGERGLLAGDLARHIRRALNPRR